MRRSRFPARRAPVLAVLAALLLAAGRAAAEEPQVPRPRGFVNDFAGVMDGETARRLEALIGELKAKTGAEIAVVTVESTKPLAAFDYAMKIAESWRPGSRERDNGVVFLVAVKDRETFILTGYGVEGALPDGRVGEIRDRLLLPRFRQGDYAGGIRAATEEMATIIAREHGVVLSGATSQHTTRRHGSGQTSGWLGLFLIILFFLIVSRTGLLPLLMLGGMRRGGHFGRSFGGGGFGGSGGGFGGFGGGGFGGGGAGGRW